MKEKNKLSFFVSLSYLHNHDRNILRICDVLPNFPFATSETEGDY